MLKKQRVFGPALVLLFVAAIAFAQSQPTPRQGQAQNKGAATKQQTAPDERGTEQAPLIVKVLPAEQAQQKPANPSQKPDKPDEWGLSDKIAAVAIGIGFLQFVVLVATVWVMRREAQRQLRAYVFISNSQICAATQVGTILNPPQAIREGVKPVAMLVIKNTGQTPAYDLQIFGWMDQVPWPIDKNRLSALPFEDTTITKSAIGPGETTNKYELLADERALTSSDEIDLASGKIAIVVHGEIHYRDAFGRKRETRYRLFTGGAIGIRSISLAAHQDGNTAT